MAVQKVQLRCLSLHCCFQPIPHHPAHLLLVPKHLFTILKHATPKKPTGKDQKEGMWVLITHLSLFLWHYDELLGKDFLINNAALLADFSLADFKDQSDRWLTFANAFSSVFPICRSLLADKKKDVSWLYFFVLHSLFLYRFSTS